ncbi:hypothetical protein OSB04_003641 [Centaurea solstitialis]|uniref:Uncharacterized protein n=1 Tax=Centaurea solstitialis TaxID=347529 RepID=A0AA38TV96_9ASTR|nr:hypothetical protein OSB04_003641 [Centaurea solstitialis]
MLPTTDGLDLHWYPLKVTIALTFSSTTSSLKVFNVNICLHGIPNTPNYKLYIILLVCDVDVCKKKIVKKLHIVNALRPSTLGTGEGRYQAGTDGNTVKDGLQGAAIGLAMMLEQFRIKKTIFFYFSNAVGDSLNITKDSKTKLDTKLSVNEHSGMDEDGMPRMGRVDRMWVDNNKNGEREDAAVGSYVYCGCGLCGLRGLRYAATYAQRARELFATSSSRKLFTNSLSRELSTISSSRDLFTISSTQLRFPKLCSLSFTPLGSPTRVAGDTSDEDSPPEVEINPLSQPAYEGPHQPTELELDLRYYTTPHGRLWGVRLQRVLAKKARIKIGSLFLQIKIEEEEYILIKVFDRIWDEKETEIEEKEDASPIPSGKRRSQRSSKMLNRRKTKEALELMMTVTKEANEETTEEMGTTEKRDKVDSPNLHKQTPGREKNIGNMKETNKRLVQGEFETIGKLKFGNLEKDLCNSKKEALKREMEAESQ